MNLHLIHPALVHFTVASVILGGGCEAWGLWVGREPLARWGSQLLLVGLVSLVPTVASGYLAANTVALPAGAETLLYAHERNGWFVLGLLLASQFWKAWCGGRLPAGQRRPYALVLVAAMALTVYSAWLGGRMVYGLGVGVL